MVERGGGVSFGDMTGQKKGRDFSIHQDEIERTSIDLCLEGKKRDGRTGNIKSPFFGAKQDRGN